LIVKTKVSVIFMIVAPEVKIICRNSAILCRNSTRLWGFTCINFISNIAKYCI